MSRRPSLETGGGIRHFQRLPERVRLFWGGEKFDWSRKFHLVDYSTFVRLFLYIEGLKPLKQRASSQGYKPWVSAPKGVCYESATGFL